MNCRGCGGHLDPEHFLCDLGNLPLVNKLLTRETLNFAEVRYPHKPLICPYCLLVQMTQPIDDIFTDDYPFFSGASAAWYGHCKRLADKVISTYNLGSTSRVLEIGSNDGTMLRRFRGRGVMAIGVEPCKSVAQHALMEGLPTIMGFWGTEMAKNLVSTAGVPIGHDWKADLVIASNVLAHVPDLLDFLKGIKIILADDGRVVFEVAYLGNLVNNAQFDQVYAEHYSYFSVNSLCDTLMHVGLWPHNIEYLNIHGGSIRVYAGGKPISTLSPPIKAAINRENMSDWHSLEGLKDFAGCAPRIKRSATVTLANLLLDYGHANIVGYGASAKAAVMLNYFGIGPEIVKFIADTTPAKWGKYIPGVKIPIVTPQQLEDAEPDVVINFAWNWKEESEARILAACPNAKIVYLHHAPALGLSNE